MTPSHGQMAIMHALHTTFHYGNITNAENRKQIRKHATKHFQLLLLKHVIFSRKGKNEHVRNTYLASFAGNHRTKNATFKYSENHFSPYRFANAATARANNDPGSVAVLGQLGE